MSGSQFNISYLPEEDRLLMQMNTPSNEHFKFLLTRRLTKQLVAAISQIMSKLKADDGTSMRATVQTEDVKDAMRDFEHTEAVAKADFNTPFEATATSYPLGKAAILLHTMQIKLLNDHSVEMKLIIEEKKSLDIHLTQQSLHALSHIFDKSIGGAEWDLMIQPKKNQKLN